MRWKPKPFHQSDDGEPESYPSNPGQIQYQDAIGSSDTTQFMRMQTEIEKKDNLIDDKFIIKHKSRIIACNKFAPLSNISNPKQIQIQRLRNIKIDLLEAAGLYDVAERTALDSVSDFQISRGMGGFYQKALITQRYEMKDDARKDKASRLGGMFRRKEPELEEESE